MIGRRAAAAAFMIEVEQPMEAGTSALLQELSRFLRLKPDELASLAGLEARRPPETWC
jgi:hypothetical protein